MQPNITLLPGASAPECCRLFGIIEILSGCALITGTLWLTANAQMVRYIHAWALSFDRLGQCSLIAGSDHDRIASVIAMLRLASFGRMLHRVRVRNVRISGWIAW